MPEALPPETVAFVLSELDTIVSAIEVAVRAASPVYGEVLSAPEGIGLRLGIEQAIRAFLEAVGRGERPGEETDELWRRLGEAEFQAGRGLDELRVAFRAGTRAAWRTAAELATDTGVSAPVAITLAEAIFVYTDDLAGDVVEGYLRMQSDEAGERERRRRRLAAVLLDPGEHDAEAVARAAELARWPMPQAVAAVALADDAPPAATGSEVLSGSDEKGPWLIVPDPDGPGRAAELDRALAGRRAAVGPAVSTVRARDSLRWARLALALPADGAAPVRVSDNLDRVLLLAEPGLARLLSEGQLAPMRELGEGERERLSETLRAWLDHQRHTPAIAEALHVHPQTVRYRIARLRELFGDALDRPDGRFLLELALRAQDTVSTVA